MKVFKDDEPIEGVKFDEGKLDPTLLTIDLVHQVESVMRVLAHGAMEHTPRNWQHLKDDRRWAAAQDRHWLAINRGEWIDDGEGGTGEPHMACIIAGGLFRMWHKENT